MQGFLWVIGNQPCSVRWFFLGVLDPSTLGAHIFFYCIPFLRIFSVPNAPIGGVQILFGQQKQWNPPCGSDLPLALKCLITGRFILVVLEEFDYI
jgi:hypothetical protein